MLHGARLGPLSTTHHRDSNLPSHAFSFSKRFQKAPVGKSPVARVLDTGLGKHIAIAVFVSDSPANEKTREAVIAKIAKVVWGRWSK